MSLDYGILQAMLKFTPEGLINEFWEQFKFEYGEKKAIEIVRKVEDSDKIQEYLSNILVKDIKPSPKGLERAMNSMSYFMFSKEETLCLGGLTCFLLWRNRWMSSNNVFNAVEQERIDLQIVDICVDFINDCSINKYAKNDNFFLRFERRIGKLARNEGMI